MIGPHKTQEASVGWRLQMNNTTNFVAGDRVLIADLELMGDDDFYPEPLAVIGDGIFLNKDADFPYMLKIWTKNGPEFIESCLVYPGERFL